MRIGSGCKRPGKDLLHLIHVALAGELGGKLSEWTGTRWVVSVGREAVEPTIGEVLRAERAAKIAEAKQDPAIISLLKAFPDAKVIDVRAAPTASNKSDGEEEQ